MKGRMRHPTAHVPPKPASALAGHEAEAKDTTKAKRGGRLKKGGAVQGNASHRRLDKRSRGGKWIQGAIKHPGALHRALGVPEGEKIPAKKMAKAKDSSDPRVRKMAALAHTLKGMN